MDESDKPVNTDWDVEKYFDETEPEEHWELRKEFINAHKDKYSEHYLVALAKVFTNVEFMGCSYGSDVMELIAQLSDGVADSYREKKKTKLQRTFVKASDAAESKFAGSKKRLSDAPVVNRPSFNLAEPKPQTMSSERLEILHKVMAQPGVLGQLILVINLTQPHTYNVLQQAASIIGKPLTIKTTGNTNDEMKKEYSIAIDGEIIGTGFADKEKQAKLIVGEIALKNVQKTCFTIQEIVSLKDIAEPVSREDVFSKANDDFSYTDNIGSKMMKMMGWNGKGLGKNEDGMINCIKTTTFSSRSGIGADDDHDTRGKLEEFILNYAKSDKETPLLFAMDFSNDERKYIHQIVNKFNLRSKSYGSEELGTRQALVCRKIVYWDLVKKLLKAENLCSVGQKLILPTELSVNDLSNA